MSSLKEGVGIAQTLDRGGGVTPTYSPEKGAGQSQKNHGREALPLAMILLLCLETVEGTRKKRDTPSHYLPKGRRERKREKKKKGGGKKGRKSHVSLKWLYIQNK